MRRHVGYVRESARVDETARPQLAGWSGDVFIDRAAVRAARRPQRTAAIRSLGAGERLVVQSLDRLAATLAEIRALVAGLLDRQCEVQFLDEGLLFLPGERNQADAVLRLLEVGASFVALVNRDHQREGLHAAKASPQKYTGRKPKLDLAEIKQMLIEARAEGADIEAVARRHGVSRATVYRYLRQGVSEQALEAEERARRALKAANRAAKQATRGRVAANKRRSAAAVSGAAEAAPRAGLKDDQDGEGGDQSAP